jgi:uncharacterized glyoxalase superfamily protein PhnB
MKIPEQYLPLMPYLILRNAQAFVDFAKFVFGATEQMMVPDEKGQIMHGELKIFDAVVMIADASDEFKEKPAGMYIYVDDVDAIYKRATERGADPLMPPQEKDYGYTAGFEDAFGNQWWVAQADL